jgi:hypothetical protein
MGIKQDFVLGKEYINDNARELRKAMAIREKVFIMSYHILLLISPEQTNVARKGIHGFWLIC